MLQIKNLFKNHKKLAILVLCIALCGVGAGGFYGYRWYEYRQTSAFAMEKLKNAISPADPESLAKLVDFRSVSQDLAQAIMKSFPFYLAGQEQDRKISDALQTAILKHLSEKPASFAVQEEENEEKALQKPLIILPPDFGEQFVKNMNMHETSPDSAMLSTTITNPQLERPVKLLLKLQKGPNGWRLNHVLNATELASQLRGELLKRHIRLREVFEAKNSATRKKMEQTLPMVACNADGGLLSDGKTFILMIHVLARNISQIQANNYSVDVSIFGKNNNLVEKRFLNTAKPVGPGEDFEHRWSFELESQSPLAQELMANLPLHCSAAWQTLGLGNSQVWHIEEVPNPDRACMIEGHDHPEGFCLIPIFQP